MNQIVKCVWRIKEINWKTQAEKATEGRYQWKNAVAWSQVRKDLRMRESLLLIAVRLSQAMTDIT